MTFFSHILVDVKLFADESNLYHTTNYVRDLEPYIDKFAQEATRSNTWAMSVNTTKSVAMTVSRKCKLYSYHSDDNPST